jgi:hypothetical protein
LTLVLGGVLFGLWMVYRVGVVWYGFLHFLAGGPR